MAEIQLESISIKGFRTYRNLSDFGPGALNIFIGPNGSGKSNFIGFFNLLSWMLSGKLQERITQLGGAGDILFDGPESTEQMEAHLGLRTEAGLNEFRFALRFAKPDRLYFSEEGYRFTPNALKEAGDWTWLGGGHTESKLAELNQPTAATIRNLLRKLVVYQFHNTTDKAPIRLHWSKDDARWLKSNGQNLGAFLHRLHEEEFDFYARIRRYIRAILPFFDDFEFSDSKENSQIMLRWKETGTEKVFHAGHASDGMLRAIALIALLAQNPAHLPAVLFLDEPELGLHPAALEVVAGLLKAASLHCQVFVSTQSVSFVDAFLPDDLVVVERKGRETLFQRHSSEELGVYLEDFSSGQIWAQNIIGGQP